MEFDPISGVLGAIILIGANVIFWYHVHIFLKYTGVL